METPCTERPPARLGLWDTASIIVAIIIGVGIFKTPPDVFRNAGGPWEAMALWLLGGLLVFGGALCFAELASTYPRSGGEYVYLTRAYGPGVGFLFGWAQMAVIRTGGSIAVLAYPFAEYAGRLLDVDAQAPQAKYLYVFLAVAPIVLLTVINILGLTFGKRTQNLMTIAKVLGLGAVLVVGLFWPHAEPPGDEPRVVEGSLVRVDKDRLVIQENDTERAVSVSPAAKVTIDGNEKTQAEQAVYAARPQGRLARQGPHQPRRACGGRMRQGAPKLGPGGLRAGHDLRTLDLRRLARGAYVAAEVRRPRRNLPLALMLGTAGVMILYLLINAAYLVALGFENAEDSQAVAADVLALALGKDAGRAMSLLVVISTLGAINAVIITGSRIYAEVASDHRLFAPWRAGARAGARLRAPWWSRDWAALRSSAWSGSVGRARTVSTRWSQSPPRWSTCFSC